VGKGVVQRSACREAMSHLCRPSDPMAPRPHNPVVGFLPALRDRNQLPSYPHRRGTRLESPRRNGSRCGRKNSGNHRTFQTSISSGLGWFLDKIQIISAVSQIVFSWSISWETAHAFIQSVQNSHSHYPCLSGRCKLWLSSLINLYWTETPIAIRLRIDFCLEFPENCVFELCGRRSIPRIRDSEFPLAFRCLPSQYCGLYW
jgi:hypothetical protein